MTSHAKEAMFLRCGIPNKKSPSEDRLYKLYNTLQVLVFGFINNLVGFNPRHHAAQL